MVSSSPPSARTKSGKRRNIPMLIPPVKWTAHAIQKARV